jgi:hypothetical protein
MSLWYHQSVSWRRILDYYNSGLLEDSRYTGAIAAVTIENMDVFAERPWVGLQRVTEVIALGEHNWASMHSSISKQYNVWNNNNQFRCGGGT